MTAYSTLAPECARMGSVSSGGIVNGVKGTYFPIGLKHDPPVNTIARHCYYIPHSLPPFRHYPLPSNQPTKLSKLSVLTDEIKLGPILPGTVIVPMPTF